MVPLGIVDGLLWPVKPAVAFNRIAPTITKVPKVVHKVGCRSAPGLNTILYAIYKHCPKVLGQLHRISKSAWKKRRIGKVWRQVIGIYILK